MCLPRFPALVYLVIGLKETVVEIILMVMWIVNVNYNHHGYYSTDGE